ncbi:hypothetical protein OPT61_g9442 [Boeremia exigua]|uniref:Uncharacterized protein n=1 Tax=Boeremia exigua TaxID=749465 RepID=A0ACC2HUW9_9PLEO|nr:hypothetical protein OPT61_g9442 [Boeremia exigua]
MSSMTSLPDTDSDDDGDFGRILEIDLDSPEAARSVLAARRTITSNFQYGHQAKPEYWDIAASIFHHSGDDQEPVIRVITRSPDSTRLSPKERWLHYATNCISFDHFKRNAINTTLQHHPDCVPVAMHLLSNVQDRYEQRSAYGSYIEPGTVMRCDGTERLQPHKPDLSVTFASLPYFDISQQNPLNAPEDESLHLTRSLFQCYYPQEDTRDRDDSQQFRTFRHVPNGHYLRVPQLWVLILNSTTIVSCGPSSLLGTSQGYHEVIPESSLVGFEQQLVHVTDFHKRVTVLPAESCSSYLQLRQSIQEECLSKTMEGIDQCNLHLGDSEAVLDPGVWPSLVGDAKTAFVYVRISRKRDVVKDLKTEGEEPQKMIKYTDLGSDEESPKGKELTLYTKEPPRKDFKDVALLKSNDASRQRLEDQGYVVNNEMSLQRGEIDLFKKDQPKIFKRPTVVDAEADDIRTSYSPSLDSAHQSDESSYEEEVDKIGSGESEDSNSQSSRGIRVRFQLDEELEADTASFRSSRRSYDRDSMLDSERSTAAGDLPSNLDEPGPSHNTSQQLATPTVEDSSLVPWGYPRKSIAPAANAPHQARVEDYDSSASSDEEEARSEQLDVVKATHDANLPAHDSTPHPGSEDGQVSIDKGGRSGEEKSVSNAEVARESPVPESAKPSTIQNLTEEALRKVIRDEITAALGKSSEGLEPKYLEHMLRTRLAQFGFQENQIQAMLHPESQPPPPLPPLPPPPPLPPLPPPPPPPPPSQQTFARIHKQHLDVETLQHYDIPYQIDANDANYIIIFREMSSQETDILLEHTQRLRARYGWTPERDDRSRRDTKEQPPESETRRSTSRSRRRSHKGHNPHTTPYGGEQKTNASNVSLTDESGSPEPSRDQFDVSLRVPPFLAWPTTLEEQTSIGLSANRSKRPLGVEADEGIRIKLTLLAIKQRIYNSDSGNRRSMHSKLIVYKSAATTVEISNGPCPKKLFSQVPPDPLSIAEDRSGNGIHKELTYMQLLNQQTGTDTGAKPAAAFVAPQATSLEVSSRRVIPWQMAQLYLGRNKLRSTLRELINQFVPEQSNHTLVQRCWGSISTIVEVLDKAYESNVAFQRKNTSTENPDAVFMIQEVPDDGYRGFHQITPLSLPIEKCRSCLREKRYYSIADALDHLQQKHSSQIEGPADKPLTHWIVSFEEQGMERSNTLLLQFLETIQRYSGKLLSKSIEIRSSVADKDNSRGSNYLLPTALVKAAEKVFQYIYYSAYSFDQWQKRGFVPSIPEDLPPLLPDQAKATGMEYFAKIADVALSNARDELMMMALTGKSRDSVQQICIPPESSVLSLFVTLMGRPLIHGLRIEELYREHLVALRYKATRKPSKRILREVYLWKEEMEVVASVARQQAHAILALGSVLDSATFRITNRRPPRLLSQPAAPHPPSPLPPGRQTRRVPALQHRHRGGGELESYPRLHPRDNRVPAALLRCVRVRHEYRGRARYGK